MTKNRWRIVIAMVLAAFAMLVAACDYGEPTSQETSQDLSEKIAKAATDPAQGGVSYPFGEMQAGGWREEQMLAEHLKRQASPSSQRYVVFLTQQGQLVTQFAIQGMVFDPNSQMTTTQMVNRHYTGNEGVVTNAPGDNGTYGPEAGAAAFFTTSGVEIQVPKGMIWIESDSPLGITSTPLVTYNINAVPTYNGGGVHIGGK